MWCEWITNSFETICQVYRWPGKHMTEKELTMKYKNKSAMSAVNMKMFGIQAIVLTKHHKLHKLRTFFEGKKYKNYLGDITKQQHFDILKANLLKEDAFFNANLGAAVNENPRWTNFCEDCVWLAVLSSCMFDHPVHLMHPDSYMDNIGNSMNTAPTKAVPDLITGIDVVRMDR